MNIIPTKALPFEPSSRYKAGSIGEKNQQKVLEAAVKVFSRKGLSGARVEEIAKEAGMSKSNMLYYFKTKEELYQVVILRVLRHWLSTLSNLHSDDQPIDVITTYISKKIQMSQQYPEASRLIAMETMGGTPASGDFLRTELNAWIKVKGQVFLKWQNEGLMAPIEPAYVFFMIWALTQAYANFDIQIATLNKPNGYRNERYPPVTRYAIEVLIRGFELKPRL